MGTVLAAGGRQLRPDAGTRQQTSELEAGGSLERDPWEHRAGTGWGVLASWGAGFGIKGRLDQLVEGAVGVMRGWPPCLGRSEPGPGWQGGAAQELGQGKCSVKVRVRAVGLSEGRGGCSESTGGAGSGGPGGGASASRRPAAPPGGRAGAAPAPSAAGQGHRAQEGHSRDFRKPAALLNCCSASPPSASDASSCACPQRQWGGRVWPWWLQQAPSGRTAVAENGRARPEDGQGENEAGEAEAAAPGLCGWEDGAATSSPTRAEPGEGLVSLSQRPGASRGFAYSQAGKTWD